MGELTPGAVEVVDHELTTGVELRAVTLRAGPRILLENTSRCFEAGKITLIVGRSGVGKSTLLKAIAGLIDAREEGLHLSGSIVRLDERGRAIRDRRSVGVVFQDFALFDELSPLQNVRLANAHASSATKADSRLAPTTLLSELGVPLHVRTASLSGGQRQRLAIARVLAYGPDVVLYDEPTSGLDSATAAEVTRIIGQTYANHPRTLLIVTHDFEALARIADAIYLMDPRTCDLREIGKADWPRLNDIMAESGAAGNELLQASSTRAPAVVRRAAHGGVRFFTDTSHLLEACLRLPWHLLPIWKSPWWGFRFFLHYLRAVASPSAWLYIAISGAIIGFVSTYFTFRFLPSANYTKPLLIEDLLQSMGFALYRILVPILVTILIAARCGAAVASDIGGKCYGRQMDALRSLGIKPQRYLLTGILYAFVLGTPLLLAIGYAASAVTSLIVFTVTHPAHGPWFWQLHFHRRLTIPEAPLYDGTYWLLGKSTACAAGIAMIAYARGAAPKDSSRAVSRGVTSTILWATLYVLLVHFVFAFLEFE
ncbi:MAG: ATP-binding cassette domain-containing protein [Planctomycetota bacterium]